MITDMKKYLLLPLACFLLSGCFFLSQQSPGPNDPGVDDTFPAFGAIRRGDLPAAKALIAAGAKTSDPRYGNLLHAAGATNDPNIIDYVMNLGLNIEERDKYQCTPLLAAGTRSMMKALLEHGANINARDWQGRTPIRLKGARWGATVGDIPEMQKKIDLLLAYGADINEVRQHKTILDYWMAPAEAQHPKSYLCVYIRDQEYPQVQKLIIPFLKERGAKTYEELKQLKK